MTRDELQKILDDHANWLKVDGGKKADLSEADLSEANLSWTDLSEANLSWANLSRTDLSRANLRGANLSGADMRGANLSWANLSWADLRGTDLRGTDLRRANLRRSDLRGVDLRKASLSGVNLSDANLSGADLRGVKNLYLLPVQDHRGYSWPHAVQCEDGVWRIRAGCRFFTIAEARNHWGPSYAGERRMGDMYLAAIDWLERVIAEDAAIAKVRGGGG